MVTVSAAIGMWFYSKAKPRARRAPVYVAPCTHLYLMSWEQNEFGVSQEK
jgi:hypothetical protein